MPCPNCFTLEQRDLVPIVQDAGWAPGQSGQVWKFSPPPRFDPQSSHPVMSHYTNYGILAHAYPHIYVYMDLSCFTTATSVLL